MLATSKSTTKVEQEIAGEWDHKPKYITLQIYNSSVRRSKEITSCLGYFIKNKGLRMTFGYSIVSPIKLQRKRTFENLGVCKWTVFRQIYACFECEL